MGRENPSVPEPEAMDECGSGARFLGEFLRQIEKKDQKMECGWVTIAEQKNTSKRGRIDLGQVSTKHPKIYGGSIYMKPETDT